MRTKKLFEGQIYRLSANNYKWGKDKPLGMCTSDRRNGIYWFKVLHPLAKSEGTPRGLENGAWAYYGAQGSFKKATKFERYCYYVREVCEDYGRD